MLCDGRLGNRGGPNLTGKPGSSRNIVQYAVLNLASLHFHFGHLDMAMAAINETVRIAQQNGDHVCVAYALAWLHQLLVKSGVSSSRSRRASTGRLFLLFYGRNHHNDKN